MMGIGDSACHLNQQYVLMAYKSCKSQRVVMPLSAACTLLSATIHLILNHYHHYYQYST